MKAAVFVRIASVLVLVHAVLHTIGGVFGKVSPGPAAVAVAAMKSNEFAVLGNLRTFWDFYFGLGLAVTVVLTTESVVLWLLAPLAAELGERMGPVLAAFALGIPWVRRGFFSLLFCGTGDRGDSDRSVPVWGDLHLAEEAGPRRGPISHPVISQERRGQRLCKRRQPSESLPLRRRLVHYGASSTG